MDSCSNGDTCPKLLDLIERDWLCNRENIISQDDSKLELRLGPPGEEEERKIVTRVEEAQGVVWFRQTQRLSGKELSRNCCITKMADLQQKQQTAHVNTSVTNTSQKRTAPGPVVGWPPIRSFRRNLSASCCPSKQPPDSHNDDRNSKPANEKLGSESSKKGLFVKINMDGVPIGRKVDLGAYDSYEKLSVAVDELFRGLLAVQTDSCAGGLMNKQEEGKAITGIMDGSGEYTLVYEDNEGDRMLVGDVPWQMFVSTVKRLRVLKSAEVSGLSLGGSKQAKISSLK